jgi:hypothetical protein
LYLDFFIVLENHNQLEISAFWLVGVKFCPNPNSIRSQTLLLTHTHSTRAHFESEMRIKRRVKKSWGFWVPIFLLARSSSMGRLLPYRALECSLSDLSNLVLTNSPVLISLSKKSLVKRALCVVVRYPISYPVSYISTIFPKGESSQR